MESKSSHTRYPNSIARTVHNVPRRMYRKPRNSSSLAPYLSKYLLAFLRYFDSSNLGTLFEILQQAMQRAILCALGLLIYQGTSS